MVVVKLHQKSLPPYLRALRSQNVKIVIIAHFAGSPQHGMVYGHYYLASEWVKMGHQVTIVAASFAHTRFKQPEVNYGFKEEHIDGIKYIWVPTPIYDPTGRWGRVGNILAFTLGIASKRLSIDGADIIICSSHHPFPIYVAKKMAGNFSARLVFEVRDLWPLTLIELGGASLKNPFIKFMQHAEDYAYRYSDSVVSVLPNSLEYMKSRGMSPEKFVFIPNGSDICDNEVEKLPDSHIEILQKWQLRGSFIVGYAGRVGLANSLDTLIDALAICEDKNTCVAILGDGSHLSSLRLKTEAMGLAERVLFLSPVQKSQVADFLSRIDAAFIGLQSHPIFRFGISPTKLNDYMLSAKPVIFAIDAPDDVITSSGCGVSCAAEDHLELSRAINHLRSLGANELGKMGKKGRCWLIKNRNYHALAKDFLEFARKERSS